MHGACLLTRGKTNNAWGKTSKLLHVYWRNDHEYDSASCVCPVMQCVFEISVENVQLL